jgi:hypothetical protein
MGGIPAAGGSLADEVGELAPVDLDPDRDLDGMQLLPPGTLAADCLAVDDLNLLQNSP